MSVVGYKPKEVVEMKKLFPSCLSRQTVRRTQDIGFGGGWEPERLFEDLFYRSFPLNLFSQGVMPLVDLYEKENEVVVKVELPGIKPEEVEVSLDNNLLTIRGEKKKENEVKKRNYYRLERSYGAFQRIVELPVNVKGESAKANYKDGVLEIELPKAEENRGKRIKIETK